MIEIITPNDVVVDKGDVNTLVGDKQREDIPTHEEEQALLAYEEHFRQPELASFVQNAQDHAMKTALSNGFTIDESSDGITRWEHLNA